jgi:SMC interacting uncharacterized protein involved in chromosome segregation
VNLAAAKALEARTRKLQSDLNERDATIAALKRKSADLEARLARLEAILEKK